MTEDRGYRALPVSGPRIRSDVVDGYIFQRGRAAPTPVHPPASPRQRRSTGMDSSEASPVEQGAPPVYFLQVLRVGPPLADTWHPVMGHVETGETAVAAIRRELREELGLAMHDPALLGMWALEQVHPFFIAEIDAIVMSPRFAVEVAAGWSPSLNGEHAAFRWVDARDAHTTFMWPGQQSACREIVEKLLPDASLMRDLVRIDLRRP